MAKEGQMVRRRCRVAGAGLAGGYVGQLLAGWALFRRGRWLCLLDDDVVAWVGTDILASRDEGPMHGRTACHLLPPAPANATQIPPFGKQDAVRVMAKSLVRNRHAVTKLFQLKSQLQAVSLRIAVRGVPAASGHAWVCVVGGRVWGGGWAGGRSAGVAESALGVDHAEQAGEARVCMATPCA